jgi:hypothetical protein
VGKFGSGQVYYSADVYGTLKAAWLELGVGYLQGFYLQGFDCSPTTAQIFGYDAASPA